MIIQARLREMLRDNSGTVLIELAISTPLLALLAIGAFETGTMVSRQQELQSALGEGVAIALATNQGAETDLNDLKSIIKSSVDLDDEQVTLRFLFRCGTSSQLVNTAEACGEGDTVYEYVDFQLQDTHDPIWTNYGIGKPVRLDVERLVQLS